jgi:hypothetical protein
MARAEGMAYPPVKGSSILPPALTGYRTVPLVDSPQMHLHVLVDPVYIGQRRTENLFCLQSQSGSWLYRESRQL